MFKQRKQADENFRFASDLFPEPKHDYENHLALKIYNRITDANQSLSADWFEFFINQYSITNVDYFVDAVFQIRAVITDFDNEIEKIKKEGEKINNQVMDILKASGKFGE